MKITFFIALSIVGVCFCQTTVETVSYDDSDAPAKQGVKETVHVETTARSETGADGEKPISDDNDAGISTENDIDDNNFEGLSGYTGDVEGNNSTDRRYHRGDDDEGTGMTVQSCGRRGKVTGAFAEEARAESTAWMADEANFDAELPDDEDVLIRIIGGRVTTTVEFPWQVSIHVGGRHICGGAIIGRRYILSAAHCFKKRDRRHYKFYVGKDFKQAKDSRDEYAQGPYYMEAAIVHGRYNKKRHDCDIAIVKLTKPVSYNKRVSPVCLPKSIRDADKQRAKCFVSGYGQVSNALGPTIGKGKLKAARVGLLSNSHCKRLSSEWMGNLLTDNMVCAGGMSCDDGTSCKGDSGGPLVCESAPGSNRYFLQGIVSFGKSDCGDKMNTPAAYVRVVRFLDWIKKNYKRLEAFHPIDDGFDENTTSQGDDLFTETEDKFDETATLDEDSFDVNGDSFDEEN